MKRLLHIISAVLLSVSCVNEIDEAACGDMLQGPGCPLDLEFGVSFPGLAPATKFDADPSDDITNLYLIVFDENGYFTEYAEAEFEDSYTHDTHSYERKVKVSLSQTDRPRAIHFIANCPADQIHYGHEADVIGGMTVSGGVPAYWQRVMVSSVLDEDGNGLIDDITGCVPLVRNFAQINVKVDENDYTSSFTADSYYLYNDIDKGTVAPYNMSTRTFQDFLDEGGVQRDYDELLGTYGYEGHAVSDVVLNAAPASTDGFISVNQPWYMYERKISARTSDEQSWLESPNHIIIKGTFDGKEAYYKVDLVRMVSHTDEGGVTSNVSQYFNILRNFNYTFTVTNVHSAGYATLDEALANPAGNNLSGSVDTQGLVNLSDGEGRIFVSYTDTTLVTGEPVTLKYRYIPSLLEPDVTANGEVHFHDIDGGSVIDSYSNATEDVDGWRTLTIDPKEPGIITAQQSIMIHHTNANLTRIVTFTLKNPYELSVTCTPQAVEASVGAKFDLSFSIPDDLPEHMFPLNFRIEADAMTIAPVAPAYSDDGSHIVYQIPVMSGKSGIPGKDETVFYYVKTLSWEEYSGLKSSSALKTVTLDFQTNKAQSTTMVYVINKYFSPAYDWIYVGGTTVVEDVTITFSWQANIGETQTISVYNASGERISAPFVVTTGSSEVTLLLYEELGDNDMLYFRFTNEAGDTYQASNTLTQVKSGQTLNFNKI